jgi:hypothetical protein
MAVLSAGGAIAAAMDQTGRERVAALFEPAETQVAGDFVTQTEIETLSAELTRLRSETRLLALEKEAMAIKIATLESEFGPITGSIPDPAETELDDAAIEAAEAAADAAMPETEGELEPVSAPGAAENVEAAEDAASRDATHPKPVRTIDVGFVPLPVDRKHALAPTEPEPLEETEASVSPSTPGSADALSDLASPAARILPSSVGKTHFAIQLGMADSMKDVRELWKALVQENDILIGRLEPVVAIAEDDETIRLRLLAGPFADAADAIQLCTLLVERGVDCRAVRNEGQKLVMR